MKILMISSYLPYPLLSGGQVRLYNLIKELSQSHDITLICEKRHNQTENDRKEMEKICKKVITVERKKQWSLQNILKSGFSTHSFLLTGHTHFQMRTEIQKELESQSYDLIHVETFYVMQNIPKVSLPVVLVEHNIEYFVYRRYVDKIPIFLRQLLSFDVAKIKKEEEVFWHKATKVVAVSKDDQQIISEAGIHAPVVSNGVDTKRFTYKNIGEETFRKEKKVLFIGDFSWIQNKDTVSWIINEIWPRIKKELKTKERQDQITLWIVGRTIPDAIRHLTDDPDVFFDEKSSAKPTQEIFQEAYILLSPIRVGGGTSYKILESMSSGTPVVTMLLSANSLNATDGRELMVGQTPDELCEQTIKLIEDEILYKKISKGGRELIEKSYTWKEIAKELDAVYHEVAIKKE